VNKTENGNNEIFIGDEEFASMKQSVIGVTGAMTGVTSLQRGQNLRPSPNFFWLSYALFFYLPETVNYFDYFGVVREEWERMGWHILQEPAVGVGNENSVSRKGRRLPIPSKSM
jgi:hypothetical protein